MRVSREGVGLETYSATPACSDGEKRRRMWYAPCCLSDFVVVFSGEGHFPVTLRSETSESITGWVARSAGGFPGSSRSVRRNGARQERGHVLKWYSTGRWRPSEEPCRSGQAAFQTVARRAQHLPVEVVMVWWWSGTPSPAA